MTQLYLAVIDWSLYNEKQEAEWFHFTSSSFEEYEETEDRAFKYLRDMLIEVSDDDIEIDNLWVNRINEVDGYEVKLVKNKERI